MLKRILSAIVMLLILIPVLLAGGKVFFLAVALISLLAYKEFLDLRKSHSKIPSGIVLIAALFLIFLVFYEYEAQMINYGVNHLVFALMLLLFLLPTLFPYKNSEYRTQDAFYLIGILILLGTAFNSIIVLRNMDLHHLIYIFLVTVMTDTFALIVGMLIGKHPLAPVISPKKTVEGAIGGLIMGTIIPTIYYYYFMGREAIWFLLLMSFILSFISQLGDLFFSKIKRENEIKDFSNLIPGHGGILDRFDSVICVVLAYILLLQFI